MSLFTQNLGFDASNNSAKQAESQANRNSGVASTYGALFKNAAGQYGDWLNTLHSMHLDGSLGAALNQINRDPSGLVAEYGNGAQEHAAQASRQYSDYLRAQGYGDGASQGAAQGFFNNAAAQTNRYAAEQYSPESRAQAVQALLASVAAGNNVFGGTVSGLAQGVYGQPTVQVQQNPFVSLLGQVGGIAASYAGGAGASSGLKGLLSNYGNGVNGTVQNQTNAVNGISN